MCINKKWIINPYNNERLFVKCGHCPACIQEKANHQASKIRSHAKNGWLPLFVHLTYSNECVPYVYKSDLYLSPDKSFRLHQDSIRVYRDSENRRIRVNEDYDIKKHRVKKHCVIGVIEDFYAPTATEFNRLPTLTNMPNKDKLGVIFFKDVQNFIKRLSIYVKRRNEIPLYCQCFTFFICAEYGETFSRPHFHLLIFVRSESYQYFKSAIAANWLFDNNNRTYKNIEVATKASAYVSTYVNCHSYVSPFLLQKPFAPKHSHSLHFGQNRYAFQLSEIVAKIRQRDLRYLHRCFDENGCEVTNTVPYPSYVLSRYFPKFKGFARLNYNEISEILFRPHLLLSSNRCTNKLSYYIQYSSDGELLHDDFYDNYIKLFHARERFTDDYKLLHPEMSLDDIHFEYAKLYVDCFKAKASTMWSQFYEYQNEAEINILYSYDNLNSYDENSIALQNVMPILQKFDWRLSPNQFAPNLVEHAKLIETYYKCTKQHKLNQIKQRNVKL